MHPVLRGLATGGNTELLQRIRKGERQVGVVVEVAVQGPVEGLYVTPVRNPPATEMATPSLRFRFASTLPVLTAAPVQHDRIREHYVPGAGARTIRRWSTTSLRPAVLTSTNGAAASTNTRSSRLPNPSAALITRLALTCRTMPVCT